MAAKYSANVNVMIKAAEKAARGLLRDFNEVENLQVSKKGPSDFVSAADLQAEKVIRSDLEYARPEWSMLLEESGAHKGEDTDYKWIVDPLDGTFNFLHGIPHWSISIALEHKNEIIAGVIYDAISGEIFWAEKGQGAFVGSRRLRVSNRSSLADSVIATGTPANGRGNHKKFLNQLAPIMASTAGIRRMGSAALDLAYVAAGRYEGYWIEDIKPWDVAAGILILREAGGFVSEINGEKDCVYGGSILAGNPAIHAKLLTMLNTDIEKEAEKAVS